MHAYLLILSTNSGNLVPYLKFWISVLEKDLKFGMTSPLKEWTFDDKRSYLCVCIVFSFHIRESLGTKILFLIISVLIGAIVLCDLWQHVYFCFKFWLNVLYNYMMFSCPVKILGCWRPGIRYHCEGEAPIYWLHGSKYFPFEHGNWLPRLVILRPNA